MRTKNWSASTSTLSLRKRYWTRIGCPMRSGGCRAGPARRKLNDLFQTCLISLLPGRSQDSPERAEKKDAEGSKAGLLSRCAAASQVFVDIVLRHLKP